MKFDIFGTYFISSLASLPAINKLLGKPASRDSYFLIRKQPRMKRSNFELSLGNQEQIAMKAKIFLARKMNVR